MERVGDLEVNEDLGFQRAEWRVERVGWVVMILVIVLAALGLFGHGPISWTAESAADGSLEVTYERFARRGGGFELVIEAPATVTENGAWQVDVSKEYIGAFTVESITPQPDSVDLVDDAVRYTFTQGTPGASLEATFAMLPKSLWRRGGQISVVGGEPVDIRQFFFP